MTEVTPDDIVVDNSESTPIEKPKARLACPQCDGTHFQVKKGLVIWCNSCGKSASAWAYQDEAHAELARAYAIRSGAAVPGQRVHADAPVCGATKHTANGDYVECGGSSWQHDGRRLMYCRNCGANYVGEQPENVRAIIDTLGPAAPSTKTPQQLTKKAPEDFRDGAQRTQPGVDLEKYRAHSQE